MKRCFRLMILILASFVFNNCVPPGTVYEGDLVIWNPFDLRSVSNYTSITGNLVIYQGTPYVEQTARIKLTHINAFENLTHVGGNLVIEHCPRLKDLDGLKNLKTIGGSLEILDGGVASLTGLDNLSALGKDLILNCYNLTTVSGLEKITSIGGSLEIKCNALISLEGLKNLTSIEGGLDIENTNALTSLEGLQNLSFVEKNFKLASNNALSSLNLDQLCFVGGYLMIRLNDNLCNYLAVDLKNQVEICPGGGLSKSDTDIDSNKEYPVPKGSRKNNFSIYPSRLRAILARSSSWPKSARLNAEVVFTRTLRG